MIRLLVRIDEDPTLREFADETVTIGRSASNHVVLRDHRISRLHARLEWDGEEVRLVDLSSANGTFLNGTRHDTGALKAGDLVAIGPFRLKVVILEAESVTFSTPNPPVVEAVESEGSTVLGPGVVQKVRAAAPALRGLRRRRLLKR
jgi:pSer/pThr/pTyr-binding forkhead associated (FHA) protein